MARYRAGIRQITALSLLILFLVLKKGTVCDLSFQGKMVDSMTLGELVTESNGATLSSDPWMQILCSGDHWAIHFS